MVLCGMAKAANKTVATKASVSGFIATITDPVARKDAQRLVKVLADATKQKPVIWGTSIVGFGSYHYIYASGREGDSPIVGFSPRKAAHVLYVSSEFPAAV